MKIRLYKFSKRDNSTKQPGATDSYVEKNVALKDDTNLKTPSFELHTTDATYTYAYIPDWNRYYFVSDVTYINNSEIIYHLEEDVLASNKNAIGNTVAHIAYSSTGWDKYLVDNRLPVKITKTIKRGAYDPAIFDGTGVFLLSVASIMSSANGMSASYICTSSILNNIATELMGLDIDQRIIKSIYAPFDAVISCTWLPLKSSVVTPLCNYENVCFGDYVSPVSAYRLTSPTLSDIKTVSLTPTYDDFRAVQPYTSYSLLIPMYGVIDLNASDIRAILQAGTGLSIGWQLDVASGDMTIGIYTGASVIGQSINFNIGVNCPIGQTSNNMTGTLASIGGVAGGLVGAISSATTGNLPGVIMSGVGALTSGANMALGANARATSMKGGINGRTITALGGSFVLSEYAMETENPDDSNYIAKWGRPVGVTHAINNHSGYVQCDDASIAIDGDSFERAQINGYLNSGFYYE